MKKRKIAVVTGSRAEYGLLYWIIKAVYGDPELHLQLIVTGMHLSAEFGFTVREIEADGFPIAAKVKMLSPSDTEKAIAASMGRGMMGFAKAYSILHPDIIVVLGDRFEIHAAVSAAVPFRIPVAHIHGGEATEGAFDEQLRHAITKMSHVHFAAAKEYKKKIIQMGEDPKRVFCFGAPGIDNIVKLNLLDRKRLSEELNIPRYEKIGIVTYHPVTLEKNTSARQISELLRAIERIKDIYWVFTFPNADTGNRTIIKKITAFTSAHPEQSRLYFSLGTLKYLSLLKHSSVMVGNSSSGIIEAPSFKLPVVNIGDRQKGRVQAANVIDVKEYERKKISGAIERALSLKFVRLLRGLKNPYGKGNVSEKIVSRLKRIPIDYKLIKKRFYEIKYSDN